MLMRALSMVGQRLDHPTLPHPTVATCLDHAPQLSAQSHELPDSTLDLGHVSTGDAVHLRAGPVRLGGQSQQLANRLDLESEFARMTDEIEPGYLCLQIATLLALGAGRGRRRVRCGRPARRLGVSTTSAPPGPHSPVPARSISTLGRLRDQRHRLVLRRQVVR